MSKNGAQHALVWKNGAQNDMKSYFFRGHFFRSFFRAKILRTPKHLPAPTAMFETAVSQIYLTFMSASAQPHTVEERGFLKVLIFYSSKWCRWFNGIRKVVLFPESLVASRYSRSANRCSTKPIDFSAPNFRVLCFLACT